METVFSQRGHDRLLCNHQHDRRVRLWWNPELARVGRPLGGRRLSVDVFGPLNLLPRHGKHYARTGHVNRHRATYRRRGGVRHMYGVYDLKRDTLRGRFVKRKTAGFS